ncbi:hypothetical protein CDV31_016248 [Fusarium ambrosium]|uniref:Mitochondrial import inner membrane translocase subunit TIM50 n=1 Tax=Fusarium ambrosium TaxID=131363 RepID=A0A428SCF3_9HYPO|nr:hypothetical protein CDV31_016248 [Fusarium ambrosium]
MSQKFLKTASSSIRRSVGAYTSRIVRHSQAYYSSTSAPSSHYVPGLLPSMTMTGYTTSTAPAPVAIPGLTLAAQSADAPPKKKGYVIPRVRNRRSKTPSGPKDEANPADARQVRASSPPKVPSKESGGVPNPSHQYMAQAHLEPHRLPQPRRILIVMDLNGTLLHRPNKRRPFHFVERPHAKAFLSYCLDTFHVAIWSSARPDNVNKMVDQLLTPEQRERCLLVWGRDTFGLCQADYDAKVQVYKRLTSVWSDLRIVAAHPAVETGGKWDQTNTILVDDSLEKARSEPFNLLQIPEFSGLSTENPNVLPQVHDYLNNLAHEADISRFVRQTPFKLDPTYTLDQAPAKAKAKKASAKAE